MTNSTPQFKMIPDQNELESLDRDLSFYPSQTKNPEVLSVSQIESFNKDGYIHPIDIFSTEEINEIRNYFDALLARVIAEGGDSYSISSAHMKHGRVYDLMKHPKIVACVKDLLGENVVGWGSHFFCKMPHDGKTVAWHQDASYWPLSPSKAVTVWLAIDDADPENANMRFIQGSHHSGHLTYQPSSSADHNVLSQSVENAEQYGAVIDNQLQAGQISLHSDLLLHGSEANESDRRRCALTIRYAACDVRAEMEWNQKGVIVSGHDATGHWANRSRPSED